MDQADEFADLGMTCIWLPPPTDSVSPQGYMPGDLYNLNSKYGSQEDLKRSERLQLLSIELQWHIVNQPASLIIHATHLSLHDFSKCLNPSAACKVCVMPCLVTQT